jgi:hypothetical protein
LMIMKSLLRAVSLLALSVQAGAADVRPVLVVVQSDIARKAQGQGLIMLGISAWANHYVNKQSAVKVAHFQTAVGDLDLPAEASRVFGCVGVAEDCGQTALTDTAQFEAALAARADKAGLVVEITPELIPGQMLMRAVSHEVVLSGKKSGKGNQPRLERGDIRYAVFNTRPPAELAALRETNPAALEEYWLKGEPRRIVSDARRGLRELNALLGLLERDGGASAKMPKAWKQLPKVKDFKESGRITCLGMGVCSGIHVLEDNGDHFILVCCGNAAGWYDAAAAAANTNLSMMAVMGILDN